MTSHDVINTATNTTVGTFATGFESALPPPSIAFVKNVGTASHGTGFFTNLKVTVPPAGVAAGDSIIISIYASSNTITFACSDSEGNAYSQNVAAGGGGAPRSAIVSAHNVIALASGDTITCTFPNSSTTSGMSVNEFSGLSPAPLDRTAAGARHELQYQQRADGLSRPRRTSWFSDSSTPPRSPRRLPAATRSRCTPIRPIPIRITSRDSLVPYGPSTVW